MAGRVFLIDYENVHGTGLYGIDYLDEEDYVYLFFTDQANKLELNFISDIQVPFFVRRVPCGKQSLDMHLVSYLGYLIGSEPSNDCRYRRQFFQDKESLTKAAMFMLYKAGIKWADVMRMRFV